MSDTQQVQEEVGPEAEQLAREIQQLALQVEAALLTTDRPLASNKLAELLGVTGSKSIHEAIRSLNSLYEQTGRSFRIEQVAGGWQIMTLPQFAGVLAQLHKGRSQSKLSPVQLETLAIIAYKQPILRVDIEAIRGVACGEVIRALMERHLVKIVGRAEEIGRPMLYGTTPRFLELFGLSSLKDLSKVEEFKPQNRPAGQDAVQDESGDGTSSATADKADDDAASASEASNAAEVQAGEDATDEATPASVSEDEGTPPKSDAK